MILKNPFGIFKKFQKLFQTNHKIYIKGALNYWFFKEIIGIFKNLKLPPTQANS